MITTLSTFVRRFFRRPGWPDLVMVGVLWVVAVVAGLVAAAMLARSAYALPLSIADRINLSIHDGADFAGKYQINLDGAVELPYAGPVIIAGHEPAQAAQIIATVLSNGGFFKPGYLRVSIQVLELAPVEVAIEGAVFYPGRYRVNLPLPRDRAPERSEDLPGARLSERYLSDALRAAGGITPSADIRAIEHIRDGRSSLVDLTGMLDGAADGDMALISGDRIIVRDTGNIDAALARPSRITPPGIKVFMSNLTTPANNSNASSISNGTVSLAYGSRLSQAVVAGNCAGGTRVTNSGRHVVMTRTARLTGQTTTVEANADTLLAAADQATNPILLEGDSISCYDSGVTNLRDIFRTIAEILLPFKSLSILAPR